MKKKILLKLSLLPILYIMIFLVMYWEKQEMNIRIFTILSALLIFFLTDIDKNIFKNILEISSVFILLMIIAFMLPSTDKVLPIRYVGIALIINVLSYYMKKYHRLLWHKTV